MEPYFSIILPTYNRALLIPKAIQSVIDQDYPNWELLVIDDGSTDNTKQVVESFNDSRIKDHWQANAERSTARNNGIMLAKGSFICFLDSDDWYLTNHLSILKKFIKSSENNKAAYITQVSCNTHLGLNKEPAFQYIFLADVDNVLVQPVMTSRICLHREVALEFPFNSSIRISEDRELLVRIASKYPIHIVPNWTVVFEEHAGRTVNEKGDKNLKANIKLVKQLTEQFSTISNEAKQRALADAWYNLGKHYATQRSLVKALLAFGRYPIFRLKRKIHLLSKGC